MTYNVADIFEEIELELIRGMKRSLGYHFRDESKLKINYNQWQIEQLKALEEFKKRNPKLFKDKFSEVNSKIEECIRGKYKDGRLRQERAYLEAIKKGYKSQKGPRLGGDFFKINDRKLTSLIKSVTNDMESAEHSILRKANDLYRQTILKTQTCLNTGASTLDQAIDMATKDFLASGINSIVYANGRVVNIRSYSQMALRTANTRAQLMGEGSMREELGEHLVKMSSYGQCSPICLPFQGQVYIDDVYSGGKKGEANYPLLSTAMQGGAFHPNCKHTLSTYYEGISTPPKPGDYDIQGPENPSTDDERNNIESNIRRYKRLEEGSLHPENVAHYKAKREEWEGKLEEWKKINHPQEKPKKEPKQKPQEISEKPKKEFKFTPGETRNEIESRMETLTNPGYINLGILKKDLGNGYLEGIETIYNEYPQLKKYNVDSINTKVVKGGELAHYGKVGTPIKKNDKVYYRITDELSFKSPRDMDTYLKNLDYSISTGFQYKGANPKCVAIHEEVHWIDSLIGASKNKLMEGHNYKLVPVNEFSWSNYTVANDIIEEAYKSILPTNFTKADISDYAKKKILPVIGRYAFTNSQEMLAQCVSFELGGQHSEFSSKVLEIFNKYVEEYL